MPYAALGSETDISESAKRNISTSVDGIPRSSISHLVKSPPRLKERNLHYRQYVLAVINCVLDKWVCTEENNMSIKRAIVYGVIAVIVGVIMGGFSRIWDIDLDIFPFVVPVIIFIAISGTDTVISKKHKKKDAGKDED